MIPSDLEEAFSLKEDIDKEIKNLHEQLLKWEILQVRINHTITRIKKHISSQ